MVFFWTSCLCFEFLGINYEGKINFDKLKMLFIEKGSIEMENNIYLKSC